MEKINDQLEWHTYPDGSGYVKITCNLDLLLPEITYKINSYLDLWKLSGIKELYDYHNRKLSIMIPCLLDAQADRRFSDKESFGLKLVVDFLNNLKFEKVTLFHPHNASVELALKNCHIISNTVFIRKVLEDLNIPAENLVILSPDAGALKWVYKLADEIDFKGEIVCASKFRNHETKEKVQILDKQDFGGKQVLIVDDLSLFGGTFLGLANLLKDRNVGDLHLAVSSITVPNPNPKLAEAFKTVYTTNAKYESYDLSNIKLIKLF